MNLACWPLYGSHSNICCFGGDESHNILDAKEVADVKTTDNESFSKHVYSYHLKVGNIQLSEF